MTAAAIIAVVAAAIAGISLVACLLVLRKVRAHERLLDRTIERGRAAFDEVVTQEIAQRASELEATLARARADSISQLAEEERRIAEERRRDVAERERDATARLGRAARPGAGGRRPAPRRLAERRREAASRDSTRS